MAQQIINVGTQANDGQGDPLRTSFIKINDNFTQIFTGIVIKGIANDSSNVTIPDPDGNVIISVDGRTGVLVVTPTGANVDGTLGVTGTSEFRGNISGTADGTPQLNVTGNIASDYFIGNGRVLTGINNINDGASNVKVVSTNGNVITVVNNSTVIDVGPGKVSILGDLLITGNASLTGNIVRNRIDNGSSEIIIDTLNGNAAVNIGGVSNVAVFTSSGQQIAGSLSVSGNIVSGNVTGNQGVYGNIFTTLIDSGDSSEITVTPDTRFSATVTVENELDVQGLLIADRISATGTILGNIPASAQTLYVAKNGSDSNNGSLNQPFLTIKAALAVAPPNTAVQVASGIYLEDNPMTIPPNVALMGDNLRTVTIKPLNPSSDLFYMTNGCYVWGVTIRDYLANGFSYNPATPTQNVFVSPYIQNLTSTTTTGTAVKIDGSYSSSISTKAMIVGFFTIINRGGLGIHITNSGYSQLVNIYTIATDIGVKVETGGFCTLNGSDCSIGNYGLVADGVGVLQTSGTTVGTSTAGTFVLDSLTSGQPHVNTVLQIAGDPTYYTIDTILPNVPSAGMSTVVIQQVYDELLPAGTNIDFYVRSAIIASAHTFEYVGAGINPATALPQYGGIPIPEKEVVQTNGGVVTFTSTDQKGNFKVGQGFTINQATGTISGDDFYRALFATMTPYILALQEP